MRERMLCKRVQYNNGIVQVLFTTASDFADAASQEKHVIINMPTEDDRWIEGLFYKIAIAPDPQR